MDCIIVLERIKQKGLRREKSEKSEGHRIKRRHFLGRYLGIFEDQLEGMILK